MQLVNNISSLIIRYPTYQTLTEQCPYLCNIIQCAPAHLQHHSACSILQFSREFSPYFYFTSCWDTYFGWARGEIRRYEDNKSLPCLQGRRGQQFVTTFSPYRTYLLRYLVQSFIILAWITCQLPSYV
ncbi:MAG: hypothetical protein EZS28_048785, partial [Streblomastix strix]